MKTTSPCRPAVRGSSFLSSNPCFTRCHALSLTWLLFGMSIIDTPAAGVTEVCGFENYYNPSTLVLATDGNFYGTLGGALNTGMVFRVTTDGAFTCFAGLSPSDASPYKGGPLLQDADGSFYGTAFGGGANFLGSVFQVGTNGVVTRLISFTGLNGARPYAGLTRGPDGYLYGTTRYGGANVQLPDETTAPGTIFRLSSSGLLSTLVSFNRTNGANPEGLLVCGADGNLYGTTVAGGSANVGTIFRVTTNGNLDTLFAFSGTNGALPYGGLVQTPDGTLYGTTAKGGANGYGTVFSLTTNGTFASLASFNGTNGAYPYSGMILGSDDVLYGTTAFGGLGFDGSQSSGYGTVFRVQRSGEVITLGILDGTNGAHPVTGLVQSTDGYLYGTCWGGGSHSAGSIYRVANRILLQIAAQASGEWLLSWNAVRGLTYQPQYSTNCLPAGWNNLGNPLAATNTALTTIDSLEGQPQRFYRVVESP